jgi:hypothetical protein
MGAKFGKRRTITIAQKTNGQQKEITPVTSNNHVDETTAVEKKPKKKERVSNRPSVDSKVDKFTNTDSGVISSTPYINQLAGRSGSNNLSYDNLHTRINSVDRCVTPSKDALDLRNACIRRGIISAETNAITLRDSVELDYEANTELINETSSSVFLDNEQEIES